MKYIMTTILILIFSFTTFGEELWKEPSCGMINEDLKLKPEELVLRFIDKDAAGEFVKNGTWLNKSVVCPNHLAGSDIIELFSSFKIENKEIKENSAVFNINFKVAGLLSSGGIAGEETSFIPQPSEKKIAIHVIKTPYGWKISDTGGAAFRVKAINGLKVAPYKKWNPESLKKFRQLNHLKVL